MKLKNMNPIRIWKAIRAFFRQTVRKRNRRHLPYPVNYHEHKLVPPLALFVGIYIVLYAHHRSFGEAIFMPAFYKAAAPSVAAAWLMMHYVVKRTYALDASYPWAVRWWRGPWLRVLLQGWHGVTVPGFFVLIFYAFYFTFRGHPLRFWKYVHEDFRFVLFMLLGFSALLWAYYRIRTREIRAEFRDWQRRFGKSDEETEDEWQAQAIEETPGAYAERKRDAVAIFEPSGRGNNIMHAIDFGGNIDPVLLSLRDIYARLEGEHFFLVRKGLILNRRAIRSIRIDGESITIMMAEPRLNVEVKVSQRLRAKFLKWWRREG